jgi:hypothetical protein
MDRPSLARHSPTRPTVPVPHPFCTPLSPALPVSLPTPVFTRPTVPLASVRTPSSCDNQALSSQAPNSKSPAQMPHLATLQLTSHPASPTPAASPALPARVQAPASHGYHNPALHSPTRPTTPSAVQPPSTHGYDSQVLSSQAPNITSPNIHAPVRKASASQAPFGQVPERPAGQAGGSEQRAILPCSVQEIGRGDVQEKNVQADVAGVQGSEQGNLQCSVLGSGTADVSTRRLADGEAEWGEAKRRRVVSRGDTR